ncbi:tyrosine-type recombinase/integrase [Actinophytocola sediminis]
MTTPDTWRLLTASWEADLKGGNKSPNTIRIYRTAVGQLHDWLDRTQPDPVEPEDVTPTHIRGFIADVIKRTSAGNAHTQYRSLRTWFGWLVREDEITTNPMDKTTAPIVPEQPVPIVRDDLTVSLLDACKGRDMINRRDAAIIRLLLDTGGRLSELAALAVDDVDFDLNVINVVGKGRRNRAIPFGSKTAQALARYMRVRAQEKWAHHEKLWLTDRNRGPIQPDGNAIRIMLARRARSLGTHVHAHQWRHTLAHMWLKEGGDPTALMRIMGWKSSQMLHRYGASVAVERAHETHRKLSLGDRL